MKCERRKKKKRTKETGEKKERIRWRKKERKKRLVRTNESNMREGYDDRDLFFTELQLRYWRSFQNWINEKRNNSLGSYVCLFLSLPLPYFFQKKVFLSNTIHVNRLCIRHSIGEDEKIRTEKWTGWEVVTKEEEGTRKDCQPQNAERERERDRTNIPRESTHEAWKWSK